MNWYKEIKLSFPLKEKGKPSSYTSIGHKKAPELVWIIDDNWNFKSKIVDDGDWQGHSFAFGMEEIQKAIAAGRFVSGKASMSIFLQAFWEDRHNPTRMEYTKKRIYSILDKNLNNPDIYDYTSYKF